MNDPLTGVVRIVAADGATAGAGFLVSDDGLIVTCTHVLGGAYPDGSARVVFRFGASGSDARAFEAEVDSASTRPPDAEDIAFLRLRDPTPRGATPVTLGSSRGALSGSFHAFGFPFAKPVEGMAAAIQVTGRTSEGGFEVLQVRSDEVSLGFSGAPVWDERGAVVGMVVSVVRPDSFGRQTEVAFLRPVEQLIRLRPDLRPPDPTPYRGLAVFDEEHADDYFGRDAATQELLAKLAAHPFIAVVGVSGSGKSSLVRAGLTKGLAAFALPGLAGRTRCLLRPGSAPTLDLALALATLPSVGRAAVSRELGLGEGALQESDAPLRSVGDELARMPPGELAVAIQRLCPGGLLLIVDQFERLFTEARGTAVRRHFIDTLVAASSDQVKTLITLRADFYGVALAQPGLDGLLRDGQLTLLPLTDEELLQAIEQPARRHRRHFEPGLPQRLIADVRGHPGDLPLLEFALTELWARDADEGMLRTATYEQLGYDGPDGRAYPGVQGAIAKRADETWTRLSAGERTAARRVFLSVIGTGAARDSMRSDTSRRAWVSELDEVERSIAERLADERLLTLGRDHYSDRATVEVAHEALIRAWPLLAEWSTSFREFLRWRDRELAPRWQQWIARGRESESLLPSGMLGEARRWQRQYADELSAAHAEYIQASTDAWEQQTERREAELAASRRLNRRLRILALGLAAVVLLAGVSAILAVRAADRADSERRLALSQALADRAVSALDQDIDLARMLSVEAVRLSTESEGAPSVEARSAALTILQSRARTRGTLTGHTGWVRNVTFSPDGATVASAGEDGTVRLWDVSGRRSLGPPLTGHTDPVRSVAFSPDGETLASGSDDGTVRFWDVRSRHLLGQPLEGHTEQVSTVAFTPDGKTLASAGEDARVRLWNVGQRRALGPPITGFPGEVWSVAFSPDGKTLAAGSYDGVLLWDMRTGRAIARLRQTDTVRTVAFSPDGKTVASAGDGRMVRLWDVSRRRVVGQLLAGRPGRTITSVAFSPDGAMLASTGELSGGEDETVRLWDVARRRPVSPPITIDAVEISSVAFSPDGTTLASAGDDGIVRLWDARRPHPLGRLLAPHAGKILSVALSRDGGMLASGDFDGRVRLWDVRSGRLEASLAGHMRRQLPPEPGRSAPRLGDRRVYRVVLSPDGATLASAGDDGTVRLWDVPRRRPLQPALNHMGFIERGSVYGVAFSPDGATLASAGEDRTVRLWDVRRRRQLGPPLTGRPRADDYWVNAVAFSPDGTTVASARFEDRMVQLWDVRRRRPLARLPPGHTGLSIDSVAFSPDGSTLASGGDDRTVRLWDVRSRRPLEPPLTGHSDAVGSVAFSPDGATLASSSYGERTVRLWDVRRRRPLGPPLAGHTGAVASVAFSAKGATLASASPVDETIRLWDPILWSTDWRAYQEELCARVRRRLSPAEWSEFLPGEKYHQTCARGNGAR